MIRFCTLVLTLVATATLFASATIAQPWVQLFNGESFTGWEGDEETFRIEEGAIVGGRMDRDLPENRFLCSLAEYSDFALRLEFKLTGDGTNAGVQIRSERIPDHHEVIGYQADLGDGWWGALYDESRRNRVLIRPSDETVDRALDRSGWNQYAISASGPRIRTFINGHLMIDYTEPDASILQDGRICLQIHSGPPGEAWYRNIEIQEMDGAYDFDPQPSPTVRFRRHQLTPAFISESVAVSDVNGDGNPDVLAGPAWFEGPDWTRHTVFESGPYSVHAGYAESFVAFAADVDSDGLSDLVSFGFPGRDVRWFRNPLHDPDNRSEWPSTLIHPAAQSESPMAADLNGDGRLDLLFFEGDPLRFVWLEAPPPGENSWSRHIISKTFAENERWVLAHGLGLGDLNGDGRRDVITRDAWYEAPDDPRGRWTRHEVDLGPGPAQMYVYDVDGDGDADVVSSSAHDYGIWWHEQVKNEGGSIAFRRHQIDDRISQTHALAIADLNGDGLPDLVTGKRFFAHNGNDPGAFEPSLLVWYESGRDDEGRIVFTPHLIDADSGVGLQIVVEDVTGDGRADIMTSSKKGVYVFERID